MIDHEADPFARLQNRQQRGLAYHHTIEFKYDDHIATPELCLIG